MKSVWILLLCLLSVVVYGQTKWNNRSYSPTRDLDYSLFYSSPFRHNSPSRIKNIQKLDLSQFDFIVDDPDDQLSKHYGETADESDYRQVIKIDDILHPQILQGIKNKITRDLLAFGLTNQNPSRNKTVKISTSLEVFAIFPPTITLSFLGWREFAKVRIKTKVLRNDSLILEKKYEDYYSSLGVDRDFEGRFFSVNTPNEAVDYVMASCLRRTLDHFYEGLFNALNQKKSLTIFVEGQVIDSLTNKGMPAKIKLNTDSTYLTTSNRGKFKIQIPKSRVTVVIDVPNYNSYTHQFNFSNSPDITGWIIKMSPRRKPIPNINSVLFQIGTSDMLEESIDKLDEIVSFLISDQKAVIELRGYTDVRGDSEKDIELSNERVDVIKEYLISKGISSKRINGLGLGGTMPVYSGKSENDRKLNRRVEFVITNE